VAIGLQATALGTLAHGNIWTAILEVASEQDVAAIVVGSRGRSDVRSMLLGSVSHGIVHHSHRPVLVVRGASVDTSAPG
jgi:nucleotide-binding universal stress UspA family protein